MSALLTLFAALGDTPAPVVPRSTNAWVDPDGSDNGLNATTNVAAGDTQTVSAGNRLYIDLPFGVNGSVTFKARIRAQAAGTGEAIVNVVAEFAPNGSGFSPAGSFNTVAANGGDPSVEEEQEVTLVGLTGGTSSRLRLSLTCINQALTGPGFTNGRVAAFPAAGSWPSSAYTVSYDGAS